MGPCAVGLSLSSKSHENLASRPNTKPLVVNLVDRNIQLIGWDKAKLNFSFNPETFVVREIYDADSFELKADYSANIEHFDKNGLGTSLHGNGSFHVIYSDYHILGAYYPVKWCTVSRKFQLEYPKYSARIGDIKGYISGLKNARTGEEITLKKFVRMSNSFKKPVFLEAYRAIANANIKVNHSQHWTSGIAVHSRL